MSVSVFGYDDELEDFKLYEDISASEPRTLSLGNNTSSLIPDVRAILALVLIGLLVLVTAGPGIISSFTGGNAYNRNGSDYYDGYAEEGAHNQDQFYARSNQDDMVTKMLQLEQIFKKYSVEEDECMAYVACEAANVERLAENGPLVQQVHEFFNAVNSAKPEHLAKINNNKSMWVMKQAYDSAKHRQHEFDVCKPLREGCQGVRQKKN
jgi:hypothetical protein